MTYVLTCGDEGVQINVGTRLGVLGSGVGFSYFPEIVKGLKTVFPNEELCIVAVAENAWIKKHLDLATWEQTDASAQQHVQVVADEHGLKYAGFIPFSDPKELKHGVKGHMVRPHGVHIANKIGLTIGGGEQVFHLGRYLISAEWIHAVDKDIAKKALAEQIAFYTSISGHDTLAVEVEERGELSDEIKAKNKAILMELGYL